VTTRYAFAIVEHGLHSAARGRHDRVASPLQTSLSMTPNELSDLANADLGAITGGAPVLIPAYVKKTPTIQDTRFLVRHTKLNMDTRQQVFDRMLDVGPQKAGQLATKPRGWLGGDSIAEHFLKWFSY
jgi:hypothetical protein